MFVLIIQTILLLAIAFILGCILGCLLRRLFGSAAQDTTSSAGTVAAGAAATASAGAAASLAAKRAAAPEAPIVPKPPVPTAPRPAPVAAPKPARAPVAAPKSAPAPVAAPKSAPAPAASLMSTPASKAPAKAKSAAKTTAKSKAGTKASPKAKSASKNAASGKVAAKSSTSKAADKAAPKPSAANKDNLKLIRGIGPQNEGRLNALDVFRFDQIAAWKTKDEKHYGDVLAFPGRIEREEWVKQAKVLAKGGTTEFAGRVKAGDVESSTGKADAGDMGKKPATLTAARGGKGDNLTLIDGVGNAIEKKLFKMGIFHFDQIAAMSNAELTWLGNAVGFPGRPERENWAGESKVLAKGGTTQHAKRVERGEIKTSRKS